MLNDAMEERDKASKAQNGEEEIMWIYTELEKVHERKLLVK